MSRWGASPRRIEKLDVPEFGSAKRPILRIPVVCLMSARTWWGCKGHIVLAAHYQCARTAPWRALKHAHVPHPCSRSPRAPLGASSSHPRPARRGSQGSSAAVGAEGCRPRAQAATLGAYQTVRKQAPRPHLLLCIQRELTSASNLCHLRNKAAHDTDGWEFGMGRDGRAGAALARHRAGPLRQVACPHTERPE